MESLGYLLASAVAVAGFVIVVSYWRLRIVYDAVSKELQAAKIEAVNWEKKYGSSLETIEFYKNSVDIRDRTITALCTPKIATSSKVRRIRVRMIH